MQCRTNVYLIKVLSLVHMHYLHVPNPDFHFYNPYRYTDFIKSNTNIDSKYFQEIHTDKHKYMVVCLKVLCSQF